MAVAIIDSEVWLAAMATIEDARDAGEYIPPLGTDAYRQEVAEVVLLLVERLRLPIDQNGRLGTPAFTWPRG